MKEKIKQLFGLFGAFAVVGVTTFGGRFRLRDQRDAVAVDAYPARKGAGGVPGGRHRQHRRV